MKVQYSTIQFGTVLVLWPVLVALSFFSVPHFSLQYVSALSVLEKYCTCTKKLKYRRRRYGTARSGRGQLSNLTYGKSVTTVATNPVATNPCPGFTVQSLLGYLPLADDDGIYLLNTPCLRYY